MTHEDQIAALFAEANPVPSLDMLDPLESLDIDPLESRSKRRSVITDARTDSSNVRTPAIWPRLALLAAVPVIAAAGLFFLGDRSSNVSTASGPTTRAATTPTSAEEQIVVKVSSSDLGDILVSGSGHTLYLFALDNQGESMCDTSCAVTWPPVWGPAVAGEGVDESLLGITPRSDGTQQATYNGWPLYWDTSDLFPGSHVGEGQDGLWWVIDASGNAVEPDGTVVRISSMSDPGILVSGSGHTLYLFAPDNQGEPTCRCGYPWIPAAGPALAGEGADESLVGTVTPSRGTAQATYNGWPLYYNQNDLLPGMQEGQGENDSWWVIDAFGNTVGK